MLISAERENRGNELLIRLGGAFSQKTMFVKSGPPEQGKERLFFIIKLSEALPHKTSLYSDCEFLMFNKIPLLSLVWSLSKVAVSTNHCSRWMFLQRWMWFNHCCLYTLYLFYKQMIIKWEIISTEAIHWKQFNEKELMKIF